MVFKSMYGKYLSVDVSLLSSLIRSVLIRLLTSVSQNDKFVQIRFD